MRKPFAAVLAVLGAWVVLAALTPAAFAAKKKATPTPAATINKEVNACGCYRDSQGACFCGKKGKCACPGECEPKGCDEKRAKDIEREVANETRKAAEADRKQRSKSATPEKRPAAPKPKPEEKPKP
jgi:hypothetical protein